MGIMAILRQVLHSFYTSHSLANNSAMEYKTGCLPPALCFIKMDTGKNRKTVYFCSFTGVVYIDIDESGGGKMAKSGEIAREHDSLTGRENASLYYQYWKVENPRAILIIVHGFGEHTDRYDHVARHFCQHGISCYAIDHRGHGRSAGPRWNVEDFDHFVADLHKFIGMVKEREGKNKYFMLGHSLGGEIALKYALVHPGDIDALFVSGPVLGQQGMPLALLREVVPSIATLAKESPDMVTPGAEPIDTKYLSHDEDNTKAYADDPLVCHEAMKVRFASEAGKNIIWLQDHAHELNVPCLFLQGSEDSLIDTDATVDFYNKVKEEDKKLIVYEGFYHEIFNEPESFQGGKKRVFGDVDEWLLPRI